MVTELLTIMQDEDIRKAFGLRLKELRKQKGWTQKELAKQIDIRSAQLNKYECGMHAYSGEREHPFRSMVNT